MQKALAALALLVSACASPPPEPDGPDTVDPAEAHIHGDDLDDGLDADEVALKAGGCGQRWTLPADVAAAGRQQSVGYDGAGSRCSGGATDGAEVLADYVRSNFSQIVNSSIPGDGVQMYACRQIRGGSGLSVHATGRALDIFVATRGGAADNARGDQLANWLVENAEAIGVQAIIWDRSTWRPGRGDSCYNGQHPHNDHIHVEITREAAAKDTPFFQGGLDRRADSPDFGGDNASESPDAAPAPRPSSTAFVGTACAQDLDCGFRVDGVQGRCLLDMNPARGVCTLDCAGYCPDKEGFATTFCASRSDLDGGSGGVCLPRADASARCFGGLTATTVDRYVGDSSAADATRTVCAPL